MKIWFIRHNNESLGPYSVAELKNLAVTKEDYVWKEGFTDWTQAQSISELSEVFKNSAPPPFNSYTVPHEQNGSINNSSYNSSVYPKQSVSKNPFLWVTLFATACILVIAFYAWNRSDTFVAASSTQKSPEQLKSELAASEKQNPTQHITGKVKDHRNLIGQTVVQGTLTNSATMASFKDIVLQVNYLSKTGSIINTQNFTVYEIIAPGQTINFKNKSHISKDVVDVNVTIMDAVAMD